VTHRIIEFLEAVFPLFRASFLSWRLSPPNFLLLMIKQPNLVVFWVFFFFFLGFFLCFFFCGGLLFFCLLVFLFFLVLCFLVCFFVFFLFCVFFLCHPEFLPLVLTFYLKLYVDFLPDSSGPSP